jgi:hypothetical protein
MDTAKQAAEILMSAEQRMRDLVGVAASAGDYALAVRITDWAKSLGELARSTENRPSHPSVPATAEPVSRATRTTIRRAGGARKTRRAARRAKRQGKYPKFFRRGDHLVKVGWSKTDGEEYEHKAPRRVVELLAAALDRVGRNGKLITTQDIMPLVDPGDRSEVPSYQAYLALAWLRDRGLVLQHGRQGYTVSVPNLIQEKTEQSWTELSSV